MSKHAFGAIAVAALSLSGMSAYAACANPDGSGPPGLEKAMGVFAQKANHGIRSPHLVDRITGTWLVTYAGALPGQAFIQWHRDGTEWENIHLPILGGTICMGDWTAVDANHVRRSHVGWLFADGQPSGYFTETETDEVARDGSSYHGNNHADFFDLDGNSLGGGDGTAVATRITPP